MYGWLVDGLSSLFVPFSGGKNSSWPTNGEPSGAVCQSHRGGSASRPAKRGYQSVDSSNERTEHLEVKRPRRDVIVRVVKKTFSGIAGLLRLQHRRQSARDCHRQHVETQLQVGRLSFVGINEIQSNCVSTWVWSGDVRMERPREAGLSSTERIAPSLPLNPQTLSKKHDGVALLSHEWPLDRTQMRPVHLPPPRPALGTVASGVPPPPPPPTPTAALSRSHKARLTVQEALKESDRERYRKLVEMVSEKYSVRKPLPFGRVKPSITTFPLDGHKQNSLSRAADLSRAPPGRAQPNVTIRRSAGSLKLPSDRMVNCRNPVSSVRSGGVEGQSGSGAPVDVDLSAEVAARLNLKDRELVAPPPPRPVPLSDTRRSEDEFPRLGKEMLQEVTTALAQTDPNLVLSSAFKLRITQRDLATLQEGSWLNDEVINFYLSLVAAGADPEVRRVYAFSTFFFPKLHGGGHSAVRRWTKAVDLFLYDIILVPLHLGVHWSLAVVDFRTKSVKSYDSMGQWHDDICGLVLHYLKEEHRVKKGKELDVSKWTVSSLRASEIPQQKNGSDCGVFVCKYADYISRGRPFTFRQCHMPYFRKIMVWEILKQTLL